MLFYIKHSKLISVNGSSQKGWVLLRSGGSGRPRSGPVLFICLFLLEGYRTRAGSRHPSPSTQK